MHMMLPCSECWALCSPNLLRSSSDIPSIICIYLPGKPWQLWNHQTDVGRLLLATAMRGQETTLGPPSARHFPRAPRCSSVDLIAAHLVADEVGWLTEIW